MITLSVIGYFAYLGFGFTGIAKLCDKYLNDNKVCVNCIIYMLIMFWAFLPFLIALDLHFRS